MLTHQGWFNLLIYATFTRTTNYRVWNLHIYLYPCSAPSHYKPPFLDWPILFIWKNQTRNWKLNVTEDDITMHNWHTLHMWEKSGMRLNWVHMVPVPYRYCFKLFNFFRFCKILFGLVKFKTAPDRMSGNVWEVFMNTELYTTEWISSSCSLWNKNELIICK